MKGIVAFRSAELAMKNTYIFSEHGINGKTPELTMRQMGLIASPGIIGTEKSIVDIFVKLIRQHNRILKDKAITVNSYL